ncbi:hypothetical protein COL154_013962, partial [Colletotrichum chrysophilum]
MLSGNLAPDQGQITINGYDLFEQPKLAKAQLGYLPETPPLYKELTVTEFLYFCARVNGIPKSQRQHAVDTVIERCGLHNVNHRLIANLSKGYQQRVGIAQAIIHAPAVVILDEPTSGLDPIQIREIRHLIREIANEHSVILSTHILPEVQTLCDRVQIISQGQMVFNDTISSLGEQMQASAMLVELLNPPAVSTLESIEQVLAVEPLMFNIARNELYRLFLSPLAWVILALSQLILAYLFLTHIDYFVRIQSQISAIPGAPGVTEMIAMPLLDNAGMILLLMAPLITMRIIAEERRNDSLPLLRSAPLSTTQIVL